ncbi:MAG: tetratricopeptide repeat protein, partial [Bacteroidales bacterium]|nr:tetratricopeptide repeat protein [Bacteroidales bacterium]
MKKPIVILFLIFLSLQLIGQENPNSLLNNPELSKDNPDKIKTLNQISRKLIGTNTKKSIIYANKALDIALKSDSLKDLALTYNTFGIIYNYQGIYDKALNFFLKAVKISENIENKFLLANSYNQIGGIYYNQNDYDNAYNNYLKSLEIREDIGDKNGLAASYNNVGEIYRLREIYEPALDYYFKSMKLNIELNNKNWIAINCINIGSIYQNLDNYEQAFYYYFKSLEISEEIYDSESIATANNSIGSYYYKIGEYNKAIEFYIKALKNSQDVEALLEIKSALKGLSDAYSKQKQYKNAFKYNVLFKQISDSLYNIDNTKNITQLEMQFQFDKEQKLKRIEQQKRELKYILLASGLFFLLIIIILLYGRQHINTRHSKLEQSYLKLEKQQLQNELEFKNKELTTNVMYLVKKNELITIISERLVKAKSYFKKENQKVIDDTIMELQLCIDSDVWEEFELRFKQVHLEFYKKLNNKFPDLTANEKKLCAFLRLNMTTKDISAITHQTSNSIEVAR